MVLLKYLTKTASGLPVKHHCKFTSLINTELKAANEGVKRCVEDTNVNRTKPTANRGKYNDYTREQHAQISKYGGEWATKHFSVPESTARRLKGAYLQQVHENASFPVQKLPTKSQGRPLLLGQALDTSVQEYIKALRTVGGVVNTCIVMAVADGIAAARDQSLLVQYGGHIALTKS